MCKIKAQTSLKKCYEQNVFANPIYLIYMYTEDLALNIKILFIHAYIKYIGFGWVGFYGIPTIIGSSLYIYIKYIGFGLVWFYGISTIIG